MVVKWTLEEGLPMKRNFDQSLNGLCVDMINPLMYDGTLTLIETFDAEPNDENKQI